MNISKKITTIYTTLMELIYMTSLQKGHLVYLVMAYLFYLWLMLHIYCVMDLWNYEEGILGNIQNFHCIHVFVL